MKKTIIAAAMLLTSTTSMAAAPKMLDDVALCHRIFEVEERVAAEDNFPGLVRIFSMEAARMNVLYIELAGYVGMEGRADRMVAAMPTGGETYQAALDNCYKTVDPLYTLYIDKDKLFGVDAKATYGEMTTDIAEDSRKRLGFN